MQLKANKANEVRLRLSLLTLGEIGRIVDLSANPEVQPALTAALSSPFEDVKAAASTALGAVTLGNVNAYLPFLLSSIANKVVSLLQNLHPPLYVFLARQLSPFG